jgi:adenylate kinase
MILFFGPAGAGKGVQGQMLAKRMHWNWLSSGQLLRESNDPEIAELLQAGQLVPLEKFGQLFAEAVQNSKDVDHVILDGFPRKLEQVEWLAAHKNELGRDIQIAVVIDVPEEELLKRMALRARPDDTPDAIKTRLSIYHQEIDPILTYLNEHHIPIIRINGVGTIEEVHDRIMNELKSHQLA